VGARLFRLVAFLSCVLAALAGAAEAGAHRAHHGRRINSITLTPDGNGSLIAVMFIGRSHPKLLRSADRIATYAVADVDNDGDLDIVATSSGTSLLLWRNAGRGRFVFAAISRGRIPASTPRLGTRRLVHADDGWVASEDRYDAAMPRAPGPHALVPVTAVFNRSNSFAPPTPLVPRSGRAPPARTA
jgi:hypothetical protein